MSPLRLLIVDDHAFFRRGVRLFLSESDMIDTLFEAASGQEALVLVAKEEVDLVLMDLHMPLMDGIKATRRLREMHQDLPVLMMTSLEPGEGLKKALAAGAKGYCLKEAPPEELLSAIQAVAAGGTYLGRGVELSSMVDVADSEASRALDCLTPREMDVLHWISKGLSNPEIAEKLYIAETTVKSHVKNIYGKLEVDHRTQAALIYQNEHQEGDSL